MRLPLAAGNGKVIKLEAGEDSPDNDGDKTKTESDGSGAPTSSQTESSTSQITPQPSESTANDDITEPKSDSSSSTIPQEPSELKLPEGLSLDSDLSNLISDAAKSTSDMNIPPATPQLVGLAVPHPLPVPVMWTRMLTLRLRQ